MEEKVQEKGQVTAGAGQPVPVVEVSEGPWRFHTGKIMSMGFFAAGGKEVVILWDETGRSTRKQGGISDPEWEIFKLAFAGSGKISIMSDKADWGIDYRFLEAIR